MIRKHFTGARIPRRRNAYVGKLTQNNLPICLLTRGCTCVCKKHTGYQRRTHIQIERVLMHRMRRIARQQMGLGAPQTSRGDARRTYPTLQISDCCSRPAPVHGRAKTAAPDSSRQRRLDREPATPAGIRERRPQHRGFSPYPGRATQRPSPSSPKHIRRRDSAGRLARVPSCGAVAR